MPSRLFIWLLGNKQSKLVLKVTTDDKEEKWIHNENFDVSETSSEDKEQKVTENDDFVSESLSSDSIQEPKGLLSSTEIM